MNIKNLIAVCVMLSAFSMKSFACGCSDGGGSGTEALCAAIILTTSATAILAAQASCATSTASCIGFSAGTVCSGCTAVGLLSIPICCPEICSRETCFPHRREVEPTIAPRREVVPAIAPQQVMAAVPSVEPTQIQMTPSITLQ